MTQQPARSSGAQIVKRTGEPKNDATPPASTVGLSPRCQATTRAGRPCAAAPMTGRGLCFQHGASDEERAQAGRRGALAHVERKLAELGAASPEPFKTAESTRTYLERIARGVEAGKLAPSQALAIGSLAKIAVELARLQIERDLLDAELQA